jgi:hypothetical protein
VVHLGIPQLQAASRQSVTAIGPTSHHMQTVNYLFELNGYSPFTGQDVRVWGMVLRVYVSSPVQAMKRSPHQCKR